jgi:hypothetical protein
VRNQETFWRIAVVRKRLLLVGLRLSATLPLSAYAQGNGTAGRTIEGAESGVHADILSLKRTEGGLLTLRIAFANDTGGEIKNKELPGGGNVENFKLVDFLNKRKYNVLRNNDGACLCTSLNPLTSSEPGKRTLWAKFTAPPESVTRISLLLPDAEPVDDIPIAKMTLFLSRQDLQVMGHARCSEGLTGAEQLQLLAQELT